MAKNHGLFQNMMSQLWISHIHVIFNVCLDDMFGACVCIQTSWAGGKENIFIQTWPHWFVYSAYTCFPVSQQLLCLGSDLKSPKVFWNPYQDTWDLLLMVQTSGEKTTQHVWNPVNNGIFIISTGYCSRISEPSTVWPTKHGISRNLEVQQMTFGAKNAVFVFEVETNVSCHFLESFWEIKQQVWTSRCPVFVIFSSPTFCFTDRDCVANPFLPQG